MPYVLGLDIGTTSIKAWLYNATTGEPVIGASRPTPVVHPRPGWAEHDPEQLWQATADSIRELVATIPPAPVAGLAVASMAEAGLPLDSRGQALFPIMAYYDTRAASYVEWWREQVGPEMIHAISGQILRLPFGIMKLLWLRDHRSELFAQTRHWLSVGDYIIWRLSGVYATERTLASRTMLLDQSKRNWSTDLLGLAGIPIELLPQVYPSGTHVGLVSEEAAAQTGLPSGTPVATGGHDHLCGAFAAGVTQPGQLLVSLGTAASVLSPTKAFHGGGAVFAQGLSCYCHVADDMYIVQGGLGAAGGALAWLTQTLHGSTRPQDYVLLEQQAMQSPVGSHGLVWLPHLRGSGTPERDSASRAALVGLRDIHTPADIWRAMNESLAYWVRRNIEAIEAATSNALQRLTVIGGATRGTLLPQVLADITNRPVVLLQIAEATAYGAALLAGQAIGLSPIQRDTSEQSRVIEPDMGRVARYDRLYRDVYVPLYTALQPIHHALESFANSD